jgi:hypothetical protein
MSAGRPTPHIGLLAGSLSDSEATRRVFFAAGGLAALGIVLLVSTIWWWRSSKSEHPSLAPLEVMSARRWGRSGDAERKRLVDSVRPDGAQPLTPGTDPPVPVDLSRAASAEPVGFDDLREIDALLGVNTDAPVDQDLASSAPAAVVVADGATPSDDDAADSTASIVAETISTDAADAEADEAEAEAAEVDGNTDIVTNIEDPASPVGRPARSSIIDPLLQRIGNQE